MSLPMPPDLEADRGPGGPDDRRDDPPPPTNQPSQGESNFGDSSGPLFTIYSKAAEEEDNKMVERWQKDADGILIFTGLFSAAVAALLAVTVLDLRPNSQDTSAFYLRNVYQVLADPNLTRSSTPYPVVEPPSFSPSRYAVWVNSLWFLSLVMGLSCALWAISLQQWARRYLHRAQPARCSPERRARMRAFFAEGVDKMHIPWAVEGLPTLLHLSLFLFFVGLAIFLFNVDSEVFSYVICWIGLFSMVYGMITILPLIRKNSPYNSPLSTAASFLHVPMICITLKILRYMFIFCLCPCYAFCCCCTRHIDRIADLVLTRIDDSEKYYRHRMVLGGGGAEKAIEETASIRSSMIDLQILDWTLSALGDDDSLKSFFEAIPGFLNSKLVENLERGFPEELVKKFRDAFSGFLRRTCTSNSVDDSEKVRRFDISLEAIGQIQRKTPANRFIVSDIMPGLDEVPQTVEMGHLLARRLKSRNGGTSVAVQRAVARILVSVRERDDRWVSLAAQVFGLPERDLRDYIAFGGDNVLLAILIHVSRQSLRSNSDKWMGLKELSKLDIRNTLPRLQHDFCDLWNETVQEASKQGPFSDPVYILKETRHPYIALHQGTDAAPTAFTASTRFFSPWSSSYSFCNIASHHPHHTPANLPDALSPHPTDGNTASRLAEQVNNLIESPSSSNLTTTSKIGATSHGLDMTSPTDPVHSSPHPSGESPAAVVAATPQGITSTATSSRPLERTKHQDSDIVALSTEPGTIFTHAPTPTLPPIPTSLPCTPSRSESYDAGVASVSNPSHFSPPSICPSILASHPTGSATLLRLRPRGLVNTRNICFANAVLQLLINSPPFRNLFRELGDLNTQRGAGVLEIGGATPLVDATVRFFKEFLYEEESPSTQQMLRPATGGISRADAEKKGNDVVDSFEPTYMYGAMKEKRQLKPLLDGQHQDAEEFLCLYLDALDEELLTLLASISDRPLASAALEVEEREVSQSGQTEVGSQEIVSNLVESRVTCIFGGKSCLHHDSIRTVQDALAHISQPQSVQVGASGLGNASRQVHIGALPQILVLQLNRVRYDATAGGIKKIGKSIRFAPEFEIPLDIIVPTAQRPSEPPHYKLYGVLYHHGESAGSGHYTVDVLHPNGDGDRGEVWLHIDDEAVHPIRHEDMFDTEREADEGCAYLLFYCRTSPITTS